MVRAMWHRAHVCVAERVRGVYGLQVVAGMDHVASTRASRRGISVGHTGVCRAIRPADVLRFVIPGWSARRAGPQSGQPQVRMQDRASPPLENQYGGS